MAMMALVGIIVSAAVCLTGIILAMASGHIAAPMNIIIGSFHFISAATSGYMIFPVFNVWVQLQRENIYWLLFTIVLMVLVLNTFCLIASCLLAILYLKPITEFMYRPVFFVDQKAAMPKQPMPMMMMPMPNY